MPEGINSWFWGEQQPCRQATLSLLDAVLQATGNLAGPEDMFPSSLEFFEHVTEYTEHPQMQQLFDLAKWMLQPVHDNRPTAREVLAKLHGIRQHSP